jgi:hypothetical protein
MKTKKTILDTEIIYPLLAIVDIYLYIDQEDFCEKGMERCGKCEGCLKYKNLKKAYKITKKLLPKRMKKLFGI